MSQLNVNVIVDKLDSGPPTISYGATIGPGGSRTINGAAGVNITGTLTADSFGGDGSGLTNLPTITFSKARALKEILIFDEYRT